MPKKLADNVSFEQKLEELESLVSEIENPECPLEKAIDLCARGMALYTELSERLSKLERKIYEVKNLKSLAEGKDISPVMELFPHDGTDEEGRSHETL